MYYPRLFKPESIANVQIEIQIVDTHETLETLVVIGLQAFGHHLNRTLLIFHKALLTIVLIGVLMRQHALAKRTDWFGCPTPGDVPLVVEG
jgi:hypothetical protein